MSIKLESSILQGLLESSKSVGPGIGDSFRRLEEETHNLERKTEAKDFNIKACKTKILSSKHNLSVKIISCKTVM